MRRYVLAVIPGLVLIAGFATLLPAQGPVPASRPGWEYHLVLFSELQDAQQKGAGTKAALEAKFNELGKNGWEIAVNFPGGFVFKRPKL